MNKQEYEIIQAELTKLMDAEKVRNKNVATKYRDTYVDAVKACKSVLSNHNPTLKMSEETLYKAVSSDGFSYDVKAKQYQCLGCRDYFYAPHPGSYCPNCGRRIIADD